MFERGFKSWCENVAIEQRKALNLTPSSPLDPMKLAQRMGILVWKADQVPGLDREALKRLLEEDPESWSAMTLCQGDKQLIIFNSTHSPGRIASDLMHEISHVLIGHKGGRVDITEDGLLLRSNYDKKVEGEATWLSGALLLPRQVLMLIRKRNIPTAQTLKEYGVSMDMLTYRLRVTGVDIQLARTGHKGVRSSMNNI